MPPKKVVLMLLNTEKSFALREMMEDLWSTKTPWPALLALLTGKAVEANIRVLTKESNASMSSLKGTLE